MMKKLLLLMALLLVHYWSIAQISITSLDEVNIVDFTGFQGEGFVPEPEGGQLDSDNWSITGLSDGDLDFGGTAITEDYLGLTDGSGVTEGGFYAYDDGLEQMIWIQPTGQDYTPGSLSLLVCNNSGTTAESINIAYNLFVLNDGDRGNSFNFSYSADGENYIDVQELAFTSAVVADNVLETYGLENSNIGSAVADGECIYLRWSSDDVEGMGPRDEFGLDNIGITFNSDGGGSEVPTMSLPSVSLSGDEGNFSQVFSFISEAADCTADVVIAEESTATEALDFVLETPVLTFTADGPTSTTVVIDILDDTDIEGDETIVLTLANPSEGCEVSSGALTFTIEDNDFEATSIGDVTMNDANGVVSSLGQEVQLSGIVYGYNMRTTGFQFTIIDESGEGINVFSDINTFGYSPNEGDEVSISGLIGQYNGLTQLIAQSALASSSNNTLLEPTVVTALSEDTESSLVRLENVELVDPLQWTTGAGSGGFNVDVTDGVNTYTVRIDDNIDLYDATAPTGMLNITGIGGQFDSDAPYAEGYQILPRYGSDIEQIGTPQMPVVSILETDEFVSELAMTKMIDVSIQNSNDTATTVGVNVSPSSSATEGVDFNLITTSLTFAPNSTGSQSITVQILDDSDLEGDEVIVLELTDVTNGSISAGMANITIIDDEVVSNIDLLTDDLKIYPNPFQSELTIESSVDYQAVYVYDMSGKELMGKAVLSNTTSIDLSSLSPGMYLLNIITENGNIAKPIIKE